MIESMTYIIDSSIFDEIVYDNCVHASVHGSGSVSSLIEQIENQLTPAICQAKTIRYTKY